MPPKISDIISFFELYFSDIRKQSSWDFSGPQIYTSDREVTCVALSLDTDLNTIRQAINEGCELLITHHPLFFSSSKGINYNNFNDNKVIEAIKGGLDILSYHTNIDMANNGTNEYIISLINGKKLDGFLSKEGIITHYKVSIFIPYDYKEKIYEVILKSNAGHMGNYSGCSFTSEGVGMFTPNSNATPFIGQKDINEIVDEVKIETIIDERYLSDFLKNIKDAHPYEEPAIDVVRLDNIGEYGIGNVCKLNKEYSLDEFIKLLQNIFNYKDIRTNLENIEDFSTIGICTGSGASLWKNCLKKGIKVLLTGDMKYHDALDAAENGVCIIDISHQISEEIYLNYLSEVIKQKFNLKTKIFKREIQIKLWG